MSSEYGAWRLVKSQFSPTSFGSGCFKGNLFSFENDSDFQLIYLTPLISNTPFYYRVLPSCKRKVKFGM